VFGRASPGLQSRLKPAPNNLNPPPPPSPTTNQTRRCGFSRKVVEALQSEGLEFGSFDILTVRGGRGSDRGGRRVAIGAVKRERCAERPPSLPGPRKQPTPTHPTLCSMLIDRPTGKPNNQTRTRRSVRASRSSATGPPTRSCT